MGNRQKDLQQQGCYVICGIFEELSVQSSNGCVVENVGVEYRDSVHYGVAPSSRRE